MRFRLWASLALFPVLLAAATASAATQDIGVNSAVNTNASGTLPGGATQHLFVGQKVVYNEHIVTDAGGQAQILFLDQSSMTIGPNSDLMIDQFVYDPSTGTGKLAMSVTKGVMRYVGGKISKLEGAVTMQTPSASIGIRGGIFVIDQQATGPLDVIFVYGNGVTVTGTTGVSQTIYRPGFSVSVAAPGAAPTPPAPAGPGRLVGLLGQIDGRAGAHGGATTVPTDATVASSGLPSTISGNVAASVQAAIANQPARPSPQPVNINNVQNNLQLSAVSNQASPAIQQVITSTGVAPISLGFGLVLATNTGLNGLQAAIFSPTLANGQLTVSPQPPALPNGLSFPLPPGAASFSNSQVSGQSFLSSDSSAFAAAVNFNGGFGAANGQTAFVFGGAPTVTVPTTGIGTYNGSAFGGVTNNGVSHTASGGFSATYNFGSQTGNVNFSNFDGKTFGGPIIGSQASSYTAGLSGSGVTGAAVGFFTGKGASSTGGDFGIANQSGTYTAIGVFAGGR